MHLRSFVCVKKRVWCWTRYEVWRGIYGATIPSHGSATTAGALETQPRRSTTILVLKMPILLMCHLFSAYATRFTMNFQIIAEKGIFLGI